MLGMVGCVSFYVVNEKENISPRTTNADTVENYFCCSRQFGGSGTNPTSHKQKTKDVRASVRQVAKSHAKGNNISMFNRMKKYYPNLFI